MAAVAVAGHGLIRVLLLCLAVDRLAAGMAPHQLALFKPSPCPTLALSAKKSLRLRGGSGHCDLPVSMEDEVVRELKAGINRLGGDEIARSEIDDAKSRLKRARLEGNSYEMIVAANFILEITLRMKLEQAKDRYRVVEQGGNQNAIAAAKDEVERAKVRYETALKEGKLALEAQLARDRHRLAMQEGNQNAIAAAEDEVERAELKLEAQQAERKLKLEIREVENQLRTVQASKDQDEIQQVRERLHATKHRLVCMQAKASLASPFDVLRSLVQPGMKAAAIKALKERVMESLGVDRFEASGSSPTETFAKANPIDYVVQCQVNATEQNASSFTCLMEACSGSGKSLTAAEYFVRNPDKTLYFLFGFLHRQSFYDSVKPITLLVNTAIDLDLSTCVQKERMQEDKKDLLAVDIRIQDHKWNLLGVVGYLLNQTDSVAAVSTEQARKWAKGLWILVDEAVPAHRSHCSVFSPIARLVLLKRILRHSRIHCIMLGTNTLVMNFAESSVRSDDSRGEDETLMCITHRALSPFLAPTKEKQQIFETTFEGMDTDMLFQNINPWLCRLFLDSAVGKGNLLADPALLVQSATADLLSTVLGNKPSLSVYSLYCMFQIAAHDGMSQVHLSRGFALLNAWNGNAPHRGRNENTIIKLTRNLKDFRILMQGRGLEGLTTKFNEAWRDPLTVAVCAGNGRPFFQQDGSPLPAIEVLQSMNEEGGILDETAVDAYKRDGNSLESFGGVVIMVSSWSPREEILRNLAFHCGKSDTRNLRSIVGSVADDEQLRGYSDIITFCFFNLLPLRVGEEDRVREGPFGFYIRSSDNAQRDGVFGGPAHPGGRKYRGGSEFKNRQASLGKKEVARIVEKLSKQGHDLLLLMSTPLQTFSLKEILPDEKDCEWLILRLSNVWSAEIVPSSSQEVSKRKVLMVMDVISLQRIWSNVSTSLLPVNESLDVMCDSV